MAAHILTYFCQTIGKFGEEQSLKEHLYLLEHSQVADNMDFEHYKMLDTCEDFDSYLNTIVNLLPFYWRRWREIGEPKTAEEWQERKYWAKGRKDSR